MHVKFRDEWKTAVLDLGYAIRTADSPFTIPASCTAGGCAGIGFIVHYESYLVSKPTAIPFVQVAYLVGLWPSSAALPR